MRHGTHLLLLMSALLALAGCRCGSGRSKYEPTPVASTPPGTLATPLVKPTGRHTIARAATDVPVRDADPAARPQARLIAVSPHGRTLAVAEAEAISFYPSRLRIRNAITHEVRAATSLCPAGTERRQFGGVRCSDEKGPTVSALAFSPGGHSIAVGCTGCAASGAHSLWLVDSQTGELERTAKLEFEPRQMAWSKGDLLVAGTTQVVLFDVVSGEVKKSLEAADSVRSLAPDCSAFATVANPSVVSLRDGSQRRVPAGDPVIMVSADEYLVVSSVTISRKSGSSRSRTVLNHGCTDDIRLSPDARYLSCLGHRSGKMVDLLVYDLELGRRSLEQPLSDTPTSVAVGPTGGVYLTSDDGAVVRHGRRADVQALAVSRDSELLATAECDGDSPQPNVLRLRDATTLEPRAAIPVKPGFVAALAFCVAADRLVVVGPQAAKGKQSIQIVDVAAGKIERELSVGFEPDAIVCGHGRVVAASRFRLGVWDVLTGARQKDLRVGGEQQIESLAPDGSSYAIRNHKLKRAEPHSSPPATFTVVSLSDDTTRTSAKETHGHWMLLDGGAALHLEGTRLERLDTHGLTKAAIQHEFVGGGKWSEATSPDGRWVARVDGDYHLRLYDTSAQKKVLDEYLRDRPTALAVDPKGTIFVSRHGAAIRRILAK